MAHLYKGKLLNSFKSNAFYISIWKDCQAKLSKKINQSIEHGRLYLYKTVKREYIFKLASEIMVLFEKIHKKLATVVACGEESWGLKGSILYICILCMTLELWIYYL